MAHPLDGARTKLARADEHLDKLDHELTRIFEAHADRLRFEVRMDGAWYVVRTQPVAITFPLRLGAIFGDAVQNLRSALDYVVWELVWATGKRPSRHNAFPIFVRERDFERRVVSPSNPKRSPLYGLDRNGEPWAIIENAQPYRAGRFRDAVFSRLATLTGLSNRDKHRTLAVQQLFPISESIDRAIRWDPAAILVDRVDSLAPVSLKRGAIITRLRFDRSGPEPHVNVQGQLAISPTFGDDRCQVPIGVLRSVGETVGTLVESFAPFL